MLVLTGGKVRTVDKYRELLADAGFRVNKVISIPTESSVVEAFRLRWSTLEPAANTGFRLTRVLPMKAAQR
jgi:hypothetical protein